MRQTCWSFSDSDILILQQATEVTHVSKFQHLLHSQPVGLGLSVELLTRGVEHLADILADDHDFAFDAFEVLSLLHSKLRLWFSNLMRRPGVCCLMFEHPFPAFPLQTIRWLVQLQHELHHELLARIIEVLFSTPACWELKRVCLAPACKHVALPVHPVNCEICFLCDVTCASPGRDC